MYFHLDIVYHFHLTLIYISKNFDTSDRDKLVIQLITYMLEEAHYLDKKIDDNFSSRVFENFIENLDPYKRYFYLTDIEEFQLYKTSIDDFFKEPSLDFFELVYQRYKQRIGESKSVYKEILKKPFNFNIDEEEDLIFLNAMEKLDKINIWGID